MPSGAWVVQPLPSAEARLNECLHGSIDDTSEYNSMVSLGGRARRMIVGTLGPCEIGASWVGAISNANLLTNVHRRESITGYLDMKLFMCSIR